ncbi:MAG: Na(+)-translocating NADH-quinone reductase subunit A [candidate division KSB1 bacterium]|nr:Na(+)-translocating NADH-quinone reductase subunit A [candidate division KSB1 bacterium]
MRTIRIKKGLDVPISGAPEQVVYDAPAVKQAAVVGADYIGMKPTMQAAVGDRVKLGQVLFTDKKMPAVKYTSPASGRVAAVNRGDKRALVSVVIDIDGDDAVVFDAYDASRLDSLDRGTIRQQLLDSGLWTALRARPFGKVADPQTVPHSIFVTAMDTRPHAPNLDVVLKGKEKDFADGLKVLSLLTDGKVFVCLSPQSRLAVQESDKIEAVCFSGPHPAGLPGTHIHFLDPVDRHKTVWYVGAQDVAAIGRLFTTGRLDVERIVSLAGPAVKRPRLLRTRLGASLAELTDGELQGGSVRVVSGSLLDGRTAADGAAFLGRYHQQISALPEGGDRHLLGWLSPGFNLYSVKNIVLSKLFPHKKFSFTTALHGGPRAIIPIGSYEEVMPLDILPNLLLKALAINDIEEAELLGCLELEEEDLALCTFVCPSKIDHGLNLRNTLTIMEKEG